MQRTGANTSFQVNATKFQRGKLVVLDVPVWNDEKQIVYMVTPTAGVIRNTVATAGKNVARPVGSQLSYFKRCGS
jgi:hypothetical protein